MKRRSSNSKDKDPTVQFFNGTFWKVRTSRIVLAAAAVLYFLYLCVLHKKLPMGHNPGNKLLINDPHRIPSNEASLVQTGFMSPGMRALHNLNRLSGESGLSTGAEDENRRRFVGDGSEYGYISVQELEERKFRFPSVEDRVKVYMSNWYLPPCEENFNAQVQFKYRGDGANRTGLLVRELPGQLPGESEERRVFLVRDDPNLGGVFYLNREDIESCENDFCLDTMKYVYPSLDRVAGAMHVDEIPTILQFGDHEVMKLYVPSMNGMGEHPNIPIIKKYRRAFTREAITAMAATKCIRRHREIHSHDVDRLQPVIWKLTVNRHYGMLGVIPGADRPWSQKIGKAVWRGALTGIHKAGLSNADLAKLSSKEKCDLMPRCRLVVQSTSSDLINANIVGDLKGLPPVINGVAIAGDKLEFEEMLKYKAIIMLEGNDISTGMKWALYSKSVVLTQIPTLTSWTMEEMLIPWVHYIPLNEDLTDVEEKMQWVLDNDEEARQIGHRGSLWIKDLLFHPDAQDDDNKVFDEMTRRYRAHFTKDPNLFFFG